MAMFSRLARLIKSNINALITSAEDPEKMLKQLIRDMTEQLAEAKKEVAGAIADEKRLARQIDKEQTRSGEWEKKAMLAVRAKDDSLAKEALARKAEHSQRAAQYREQWQKQKTAVDQLKLALRALNNKIEEAKRKKGILIARQRRAEAQQRIHETMSGLKNASAFDAFQEMTERIEEKEAQAEASADMAADFSGDTLDHRFRELEASAGSDDDLLALKRKMGLAPAEPPSQVDKEPANNEQLRVEEEFDSLDPQEQAELAAALAELEEEEQRELQVKK